MVTRGLLVRLEAKPGNDARVEEFLQSALPLVHQEPGTTAWFAIRFGRSEYGIVDFFPDDAARDAHLNGPVAKALMAHADELLASPPSIQKLDVLASKLPPAPPSDVDRKGLLLTFKPHEGHTAQVEAFLRAGLALVQEEPATTAWFAIHLDDGGYGIFDVFPDNGGRLAHLTGQVPRELAKHALSLLGGIPDMDMLNVLAEKLGSPQP